MRSWVIKSLFLFAALLLPPGAPAGTFGRVVAIGGQATDLALDESRGVLYIANFTANRIEVMSLADGTIQRSMNVAAQPSAISVSPDNRWLLIAHYGAVTAGQTPRNALTLIDLNNNARQNFALASAPIGVAFGADGLALVVTTTEFVLFDPNLGTTRQISTMQEIITQAIPRPPANAPLQITTATFGISGDRRHIYGLTDTLLFHYSVETKGVRRVGYTSEPPMGPRVVSVNQDGSKFVSGWVLHDQAFTNMAQFGDPLGLLAQGGHLFDSARDVIYAQVATRPATATGATPTPTPAPAPGPGAGGNTPAPVQLEQVLQLVDPDNLAVRERFNLPENLAGKGVISSDGSTAYQISDSGVLILPIGQLDQISRLEASVEDLVFQGNFCDKRAITREFVLRDRSGASTDFQISSTTAGIRISPTQGVTPATIRVTLDPAAYQNVKGTVSGQIRITSTGAVNDIKPVRLLINNREPDQRGLTMNVPGRLVDILADPSRDRFFILRQDTNEVLVFDGSNYNQIATLKTGNTPTQLAVSWDRRWLLIGANNSQIAWVYDLETLQPSTPVRFPGGHYPKSIAASARGMLGAVRCACPEHQIDTIDMTTRRATPLPSLGVWENKINVNTTLVAAGNGSRILAAQADGNLLLYDGNADSFTVSRKDFTALAGAYAASSFDQFAVGNALLNASLVPTRRFEDGLASSGFTFIDQMAFRLTSTGATAPGIMQRVDTQASQTQNARTTRIIESPIVSDGSMPFTRTLAVLPSRNNIVTLTVSGFTVLPWTYDAATAPPKVTRIVNAADGQRPVAPGGLVSIFGEGLSPVNVATRQIPLPTALGESCITVNGVAIPLVFVSDRQVNAQLPFGLTGNVTMIMRTPGGVSDSFNFAILPTAPGIFRQNIDGLPEPVPSIINARNGLVATGSNPVRRGDKIAIFLTGMGLTNPPIDEGLPAPAAPLAEALVQPTVFLGSSELSVEYAGLTPGQVGVYQINASIPRTTPLGMEIPLVIQQGSSQTRVTVRVIE